LSRFVFRDGSVFEYSSGGPEERHSQADDALEAANSRVLKSVRAAYRAQQVRKAAQPNQVMKPVDNAVANETARRGILAQAESEDRLAAVCDQRADEAHACMMRAPSDLVSYYSTKEQEHRREAGEHRDAANAHRRAVQAS
jgi:DNA-directed RNA polymerase subunit K/omega